MSLEGYAAPLDTKITDNALLTLPNTLRKFMTPFEELVELLDLEVIEHNLFRGHHPAARRKRLKERPFISWREDHRAK